jgi:hypothetical protein
LRGRAGDRYNRCVRRLAALAVLALCACAPRIGNGGDEGRVEHFATGGASFRLVYLDEDARTVAELKGILAEVVPRTARWGALKTTVTISVHPSHEALEAAVHREGYEWLRAWARYASIELQSPRTWSFLGASRAQVAELVLHELTHCVMYQNAASDWSWPYKEIPLWFREGIASVTAEQGYRRMGPESIWRFYRSAAPGAGGEAPGSARAGRGRRPPAGDPLTDPEPLYMGESQLVYGTAHHAVEFLLRRYGEPRVRAILSRMQEGDSFGAAFQKAIGIGSDEFEREFRRYVAWQGWRTD